MKNPIINQWKTKSLSDKTGSPQSDTVHPCLIYTEKLSTNQLNYIYQYNKMRAS